MRMELVPLWFGLDQTEIPDIVIELWYPTDKGLKARDSNSNM
jgi:hypothetical protein